MDVVVVADRGAADGDEGVDVAAEAGLDGGDGGDEIVADDAEVDRLAADRLDQRGDAVAVGGDDLVRPQIGRASCRERVS
jgi:hypothetical protein